MIKFKHNGFQISHRKACWKGYDGANAMTRNFEVEPFVVQQVVQREENTHELKAVEDHDALRCCWKGNVLLLTCANASRSKGC
jgi:uncharacterized protein YkuJ